MKNTIFGIAALLAISGLALSASVQNEVAPETIEVRGIIENTINATFNKIIANLTETIIIDSVPVAFEDDNPYVSGGFDITNLRISGVKSLVATQIGLNILTQVITLNLKLSEVLVTLKYAADMTALQLVPLYGEGRMNLAFEDIELAITGKADLSGGISLKNLVVILTLGESSFDLNGLINNPEFSALVSNALDDNFTPFINDNTEVISSAISPIVETILNAVLAGS